MAFNLKTFQKVAGGSGQQVFAYNAGADSNATVLGASYFASVASSLHQGDIILAVCASNTQIDPLLVTSTDFAAVPTVSGAHAIA
jgi:hypothetical protein